MLIGRSPHGVAAKVLDSDILVSKFDLHSRNYVHFRTNTLGKGYEPPYPRCYRLFNPLQEE